MWAAMGVKRAANLCCVSSMIIGATISGSGAGERRSSSRAESRQPTGPGKCRRPLRRRQSLNCTYPAHIRCIPCLVPPSRPGTRVAWLHALALNARPSDAAIGGCSGYGIEASEIAHPGDHAEERGHHWRRMKTKVGSVKVGWH